MADSVTVLSSGNRVSRVISVSPLPGCSPTSDELCALKQYCAFLLSHSELRLVSSTPSHSFIHAARSQWLCDGRCGDV